MRFTEATVLPSMTAAAKVRRVTWAEAAILLARTMLIPRISRKLATAVRTVSLGI